MKREEFCGCWAFIFHSNGGKHWHVASDEGAGSTSNPKNTVLPELTAVQFLAEPVEHEPLGRARRARQPEEAVVVVLFHVECLRRHLKKCDGHHI